MPRLALSMIVKNAAADLPECLASVLGVVDEIVIADTGSTDDSLAIAEEVRAKTIEIPWESDYAKARNLSLAQVTADWVLMLDADERLDGAAREKLLALLAKRDVAGYQVTIRNYVSDVGKKIWDRPSRPNDGTYGPSRQFPAYIDHENVRLFRRDPSVYFVGRVHETVGWRIKEAGGTLGNANFLIHHFGMVRSEEILTRKIFFYRDLGLKKIGDSPENAQAHLEVGIVELENLGNPGNALPYFERACQLNDRFGVAWFFVGKAQFALGQYANALRSLQKAEAAGHATVAAAELLGDTNYNLGHYEAAAESYRRARRRDSSSATLESKVGLAEVRTGNVAPGLRKLRHAIATNRSAPELYDRLITVEIWLGNLPAAAAEAERKLQNVKARPEDFLRAASIRAKIEQWPLAADLLRRGIAAYPEAEQLRAHLYKVEAFLNAPNSEAGEEVASYAKSTTVN